MGGSRVGREDWFLVDKLQPRFVSKNRSKSYTFDENPLRFLKKLMKPLKNHYVYHQNRSKSSTFDENPCRFFKKNAKSCETIIITIQNVVFECFCFILLWFFVQDHGTTSQLPIREPAIQVLAGRLIRDPLQTSCLGNKDLLFPDVRNRPSDSISFENLTRPYQH